MARELLRPHSSGRSSFSSLGNVKRGFVSITMLASLSDPVAEGRGVRSCRTLISFVHVHVATFLACPWTGRACMPPLLATNASKPSICILIPGIFAARLWSNFSAVPRWKSLGQILRISTDKMRPLLLHLWLHSSFSEYSYSSNVLTPLCDTSLHAWVAFLGGSSVAMLRIPM